MKITDAIEYIGIPATVGIAIVAVFLLLQLIGEIVEWCGKTAPMWLKIRKHFTRKKELENERVQALIDVKDLLNKVNSHYDADNIEQRNNWMTQVNNTMDFVHSRADVYDSSIEKIVVALDANTKMTEDMFVEFSRDRIMAFAEKAVDPEYLLSREQFNRIERIYYEYEAFLARKGRENGEVDIAWEVIQDGRRYRQVHSCFTEDIKRLPSRRD